MRQPANRDPWTVRVATWSARHRWPVFVLWFVATIGVFALSTATGGIRNLDVNQDPNEQQLESEQAYEVLGASAPQAPSERLVVVIDGGAGAVANPAFRAGVAGLVSDLAAARVPVDGVETPTFSDLVDPFRAPPEAGLVSADGSTVQVVGQVPGERDRVDVLLAPVPAIVEGARTAMPSATSRRKWHRRRRWSLGGSSVTFSWGPLGGRSS